MKHVWITSEGIAITESKDQKPYKNKPEIKVKYMGTTIGKGWPKKLSTGRILYSNKTGSVL